MEKKITGAYCFPETASITRLRHRNALEDCLASLKRVWDAKGRMVSIELAAEEMRFAAASLGKLTGRVDVEDILDTIFKEFCIGK